MDKRLGPWKSLLKQIYRYSKWADFDSRPVVWVATLFVLFVVLVGPCLWIGGVIWNHQVTGWTELYFSGRIDPAAIPAGIHVPHQVFTAPVWVKGGRWSQTNPSDQTSGAVWAGLFTMITGILLWLLAWRVLFCFANNLYGVCRELAVRQFGGQVPDERAP